MFIFCFPYYTVLVHSLLPILHSCGGILFFFCLISFKSVLLIHQKFSCATVTLVIVNTHFVYVHSKSILIVKTQNDSLFLKKTLQVFKMETDRQFCLRKSLTVTSNIANITSYHSKIIAMLINRYITAHEWTNVLIPVTQFF